MCSRLIMGDKMVWLLCEMDVLLRWEVRGCVGTMNQSSYRLGPELSRLAPPGAPSLLRSDPSSLRFFPAVTFRRGAFLVLLPMADWKKIGGERFKPESGLTGGASSPKLDAMLDADDEIGVVPLSLVSLGANKSS